MKLRGEMSRKITQKKKLRGEMSRKMTRENDAKGQKKTQINITMHK